MSGFNPLAALGANAIAAAQQAIEESTLQIGVSAEILQAQLSVGDLIPATILPASGGNDLLQIFGQTVVAQLPTGVYPGETLLLAVTGFSGSNIMVQNLGIADPNSPLPVVNLEFPVEEGAPQTATLTTTPLPPTTSGSVPTPVTGSVSPPASAASPPVGPQPIQVPAGTPSAPPAAVARGSQPMAPSQAVFVAASVRPSAASGNAPNPPNGAPAAPPVLEENAIEARIAAVRTAAPDANMRAASSPPPGITARNAAARVPQIVPPTIARGLPQAPPIVRAAGSPQSAIATARDAASAQQQRGATLASRAAPTAEASLLTRLRVPISIVTTGAARIANQAPQMIPRTFAALENMLARVASDPRVTMLRSMLAFTGKLDPSNTRALPEQIAAFVDDVLDGSESKMASIVRAFAEEPALTEPTTTPTTATPTSANATPTGAAIASALDDQAAAVLPLQLASDPSAGIQARVAERVAAMDFDVKAAIQSLIQSPPEGGSTQLTQALGEALTAITGVQLNALNAQSANPNTIAIPLPMFFREGGLPAQLRIDRDGTNGKSLNSENFHVAFILDTESLGTVAIDLQAANRTVSINVKTERTPAANRFRTTLDDLRTRLESLRYRVAAIGADVAAPRTAEPKAAPIEPLPENRPPSTLDMQA